MGSCLPRRRLRRRKRPSSAGCRPASSRSAARGPRQVARGRGTLTRTSGGEWTVEVTGLANGSRSWTLSELSQLSQVTRQIDVHCVTRWSRLAMEFRGVRLLDLLEWSAAPVAVQRASVALESVLPLPRDRSIRREILSAGERVGVRENIWPLTPPSPQLSSVLDPHVDPGEWEKISGHHRFISFVAHSDRGTRHRCHCLRSRARPAAGDAC